jgi:FG-GAP-like repeat
MIWHLNTSRLSQSAIDHGLLTSTLRGHVLHAILSIAFILPVHAQSGPSDFPELVMTKIPGAPKLSKPTLITGDYEAFIEIGNNSDSTVRKTSSIPLIAQGVGLATPAYYDWDGDGLKDLLIGEFGSGSEFGKDMGNFIRVYLNSGTETEPTFTGGFDYARPPFQILTNGTPYSIYQECCMGFMPQFIDLNEDGHLDMISGQYPGEVISFYGSQKGFLPGEPIKQEGDPRSREEGYWKQQNYWLYSSASFGDFTEDGKMDLIVGGLGGLRISKNMRGISEPEFAKRELLLDIQGQPLKVYKYATEELDNLKARGEKPWIAGNYGTYPFVVDWDKDGVLDLLVTNKYEHKGLAAVDFFRGVKIGAEHRFEPAVSLFNAKHGEKAFPGSSPFLFVTDWNNDGINDLLIGTSVITIHDKFSGIFSWNWEKEMGLSGAGRDPGFIKSRNPSEDVQWLLDGVKLPVGISADDFKTMRHQGYVYVMLGSTIFPKEETTNKKASKSKK